MKVAWEVALIGLFPLSVFAQTLEYVFSPPVKVTDLPPFQTFPFIYSAGQHNIAARGDTVYIVWEDIRAGDGGPRIYFAKSVDGARSFLSNVRVDDNFVPFTGCHHPSMAVDQNGAIYVVWDDSRRFDLDIRFAKSTNGGQTFTPSVRVDDVNDRTVKQEFASIAVANDGLIYVVWNDYRDTLTSVYSARSTNAGLSFDNNVKVNDARAHAGFASVGASDGGRVFVAWSDLRNRQTTDLYFARSLDSGNTFQANLPVNDNLSDTTSDQAPPSLVANGDKIYVAWPDKRNDDWSIYFAVSSDSGNSFFPNVKIDHAPRNTLQEFPSLAVQGNLIFALWRDQRRVPAGGEADVYFGFSANGGLSFQGDIPVDGDTLSRINSGSPSIAVNEQGTVFVVFGDDRYDTLQHEAGDLFCVRGDPITTGIAINNDLPIPGFHLFQNFPNPFNGATLITFNISQSLRGSYTLEIFDLLGRKVRTLFSGHLDEGRYQAVWDGSGDNARQVASGIYFYRLKGELAQAIKKMVLIK